MKALIVAIVEAIVRALFRKSPEERKEAKIEKKLTEWEAQERILQQDYDKAKEAYEKYAAEHSTSNGGTGEFMRLHEQYRRAATALGVHRTRQPSRPPDRA